MKAKYFITSFLLFSLLMVYSVKSVYAQGDNPWTGGVRVLPSNDTKKKVLPLIQVKGNKFVNPEGKTVLFRGLSIADPDKVERQGHWNKQLFVKVKETGANLVRLPVHPAAWQARKADKYINLLDSAVSWCTDLGMYAIIDWHSIGNLEMEMFENPIYITTKTETYDFWRKISQHFSGHNTVAFYELFNEPSTHHGQMGICSWADWKKLMENIITVIRSFDRETIPLVAGFDWAYDLTPLLIEPINAAGIGYVTHPYSNKRTIPWEPKWDGDFGFAAATYPVIATEFGFDQSTPVDVDGDHYGNSIIGYLESRGISWVAWCFDPEWRPCMLKNWNYELTNSGEFFKIGLQGKLKVQNKKETESKK
jgi:hypothetical protein